MQICDLEIMEGVYKPKYDNRHIFSVKLMWMFDLHVDSTSKLDQISAKSKLRFRLLQQSRKYYKRTK